MSVRIVHGDCRQLLPTLATGAVRCVVTSPPYFGLRDYGVVGQMGLEATPDEYVSGMVEVFREVRRVLADDGTLWLNLGDSYAGSWGAQCREHAGKHAPNVSALSANQVKAAQLRESDPVPLSRTPGCKAKDLLGIPWTVALALRADGWYLRSDIIWSKPNPMPESVTDRPTKAHEYLFLLSKSERYYYNADAISEPVTASTVTRLSQPTLNEQSGSFRVPGKTNGPMKAVPPRFGGTKYGDSDAAEHRTKSGNEYDIGDGRRNRRTVWTVATQPFSDWTSTVRRDPVSSDGVSYDTKRTPSEDCPVHASIDRLHPTLERDAHAGENHYRSRGTDDGPVRERLSDYAPTALSVVWDSTGQSSGLPHRASVPSATRHSSQSHRTDPAPATTPPCTPCDKTHLHTERTSMERESVAQSRGTHESSTELDGCVGSPNNQSSRHTPDSEPSQEMFSASFGESLKAAGCTCSYYAERTEEVSHFATFPPKLIEPCILAGSERGDTILDPFNGAGTTGLVADRLGRNYVGLELNAEYVEMSRRRIQSDAPLFTEIA